MTLPNASPDPHGHFGIYGGRYVSETLMPLILEVEKAYAAMREDPAFHAQFNDLLTHYVGRPSPLYYAERLTEHLGGAKIYFKRDELNHTGAHKINNCIGQVLLAMRMGKKRIIAETGAGQHGVATSTVCARFGLKCVVYMGAKDIARQKPNVFRMKLLGAEIVPVTSGSQSLKDAMNEALRDWVTNVADTYYLIGTASGPHPFPMMVRDFQSVIGEEVRTQMMAAEGRLPDTLVACIGGGSNAIGLFHPFLNDASVRMIGVEAAGHGLPEAPQKSPLPHGGRASSAKKSDVGHSFSSRRGEGTSKLCSSLTTPSPNLSPVGGEGCASPTAPPRTNGDTSRHAASLTCGSPGILHGTRTYLLQSDDGQITEAHSISAGLDYPGIGPEHAFLNDSGRVEYVSATDNEALAAFQTLARVEGILPALEPAHALAHVITLAPTLPRDHLLVMNLCGRGDKDIFTVAEALGVGI